ncbi:MAG: hypothetical protein H6556_28445 [Lewinellaceae bacterium]|nr:hypothetical protein [Lewinellaceae bacterium]
MGVTAIPYPIARATLCNRAKRDKPLPFESLRELVADFILYGVQGQPWDGPQQAFAGANNFRAIRSVAFIERNKGKAFGLISWELQEQEDGDAEDSFTLLYHSTSGIEIGRLKVTSFERKIGAHATGDEYGRGAPP